MIKALFTQAKVSLHSFLQDLRAELKSEISGRFEDLVLSLLETPVNFDAKQLKGAIKVCGLPCGSYFPCTDIKANACSSYSRNVIDNMHNCAN